MTRPGSDLHSGSPLSRRRFLATAAAVVMPWRRFHRVPPMPLAPYLEKTDLFQAGTGGYTTYRIPGIVVTAEGSILAYAEARKGRGGDWADIDVLLRRSTDGGRSWASPYRLVDPAAVGLEEREDALQGHGQGSLTVNNPVAMADRDTGEVHMLFCVEYGRCFYLRSEDDGQTFTEPVEITPTFDRFRPAYDWKVLATGPGHGIQLRNGRLLVPVWLSTGEGEGGHRPSCVSVIYSDDHGENWERGDIVVEHGFTYTDPGRSGAQAFVNPSESTAVQLADGRVMLNMRTESPESRRAVAYSENGATGWSVPAFDEELYDPVCMASTARLSRQPASDQNRILFSNPDSRHRHPTAYQPGGPRGSRENLTVKLSYDEGETWPVSTVLEEGLSGYSDLAVGPDHTIYCFYERGGLDGNAARNEYLTLARCNLEWLTDGKDQL